MSYEKKTVLFGPSVVCRGIFRRKKPHRTNTNNSFSSGTYNNTRRSGSPINTHNTVKTQNETHFRAEKRVDGIVPELQRISGRVC